MFKKFSKQISVYQAKMALRQEKKESQKESIGKKHFPCETNLKIASLTSKIKFVLIQGWRNE